MKVEHDASLQAHQVAEPPTRVGATGGAASSAAGEKASRLSAAVIDHLSSKETRFLAHAPGRLDIMGGFAEYSGSLVLNTTLADNVCVGVSARADGVLSVVFLGDDGSNIGQPVQLAISQLVTKDGEPIDAPAARKLLPENVDASVVAVFGVLVELRRAGVIRDFGDGVSVVLASSLDRYSEVGKEAAVVAGVLAAASRMFGSPIETPQAVAVGNIVYKHWLVAAIGSADLVSSLLLEAHAVGQVRCGPFDWVDAIKLPDDLVFLGLDCGRVHPDAELKCERVRAAAMMGRYLIGRIMQHEQGERNGWDGYLCRVSMADYVERFRDRLPTKLSGKEFIERFGTDAVGDVPVEPAFLYKIRSRTEHHIYENARAVQFAQCLARYIRTGDVRGLAEAGELMLASHWSYGQRCGLGSARTDFLVSRLRGEGMGQDVIGAKISGGAIGGVVAVLTRSSDLSSNAIERSLQSYDEKYGNRPLLLGGSSPGALVSDARQV